MYKFGENRDRKFFRKSFIMSLAVICFMLLFTGNFQLVQAEIQIPKQSDWIDRGVVIEPGPVGSWDVRLGGMISPCTVVKKDGTYFLYYIGADGDRSTDGGPRHRALGVATSTDGINFTKYSGNPVLTHLPHINEEEGIFSGGATIDDNGNIILYYGAMDAGSATSESVDSDIRLAVSSDGFHFTEIGDVVSHSDSSVWGYGDELFPVGTFQANGQWYVYYFAKGYVAFWELGLAWGPSKDNLPNTQPVKSGGSLVQGAGGHDPIWIGPDKIALFSAFDGIVKVRTASVSDPSNWSGPVETYSNILAPVVFLDKETNTWFMYHLNEAGDAIRVSTAPMSGTFPPRTTSIITPTPNEAGWNNVTQVVVTSFVLTTVLVLVILVILRHRKRDHGRP